MSPSSKLPPSAHGPASIISSRVFFLDAICSTQTTRTMPDLTQHTAANEERLKAALWHSTGKAVDAVAVENNFNATPQFIGSLTELVHSKITTAATDLERFAKHADRLTINSKDVQLLARNNEALESILKEKAENVRKSKK